MLVQNNGDDDGGGMGDGDSRDSEKSEGGGVKASDRGDRDGVCSVKGDWMEVGGGGGGDESG